MSSNQFDLHFNLPDESQSFNFYFLIETDDWNELLCSLLFREMQSDPTIWLVLLTERIGVTFTVASWYSRECH